MRKRLFGVIALALMGTSILAGCGSQPEAPELNTDKSSADSSKRISATDSNKLPEVAKKRNDTIIVGTSAPVGQFNSAYASDASDLQVIGLIFTPLLNNDEKGNPIPNVADKWDISEDKKTYTFKLKEGIKFSNGDELTADDVAFTYTTLCDPSYDGSRSNAVEDLDGYKQYRDGNDKSVRGIKVIDKNTISFTFSEPNSSAIYKFNHGIMPKSVYDFPKGNIQKVKDLFSKPVGAGPYKLVEHKQGQEVVLERNDNYFKGQPKIKNMVLKVTNGKTNLQELMSGNIDIEEIGIKPESVQQLQSAGFLNLDVCLDNGYNYIGWNLNNEKFKDKKVRQALTYGFNRKAFTDSYYKGYAEVINGPILPMSWAYTDDLNKYEYNVEKANELLDEAGWKIGSDGIREKDGEKLSIRWLTYTDSKFVDTLIPILKEDWKKIGIEVTPELVEFGTLSSTVREKRDYEMFNMAWSLSVDPDPSGLFGIDQDKPGGHNFVGWRNDEADKLLKDALQETDQEKKKDIYVKWQKIANEELPYMFLNQNKKALVSNTRVKNLKISPYVSWIQNVHEVELEQY